VKVAGLFAGVGGFEAGFRSEGFDTRLLCDVDRMCREVLCKRFPESECVSDIRNIRKLPRIDIVLAGFPCQPYSQVGLANGWLEGKTEIDELFRLISNAKPVPKYIVLENVPFIVHLDRGSALRSITRRFERLGYSWAYRVLDTLQFGLPQRRRRWYFVASTNGDASDILFAKTGRSSNGNRVTNASGFYWTEGNRGIGWAPDAIPPLKVGSGFGIPAPPAIWDQRRRYIFTPDVRDAERLQGFSADWTALADYSGNDKYRWKMIGNAVSVPVSGWLARRIRDTPPHISLSGRPFLKSDRWPLAAYGKSGERFAVTGQIKCEVKRAPQILDFLRFEGAPLSARATRGFRDRLEASSLRKPDGFVRDLRWHERAMRE
jgi:DNA (cytosine-5)-methyltransferase 1